MNERSWQLAHFSEALPSGDYRTLQEPEGANWHTRVLIPMQVDGETGIVAVQVTQDQGGYWYLPGGSVEEGETLVQCAIREVQEETHLHVSITRLLYIREYRQQRTASMEFYLLARYESGTLQKGYDPEPDALPLDDVRLLSWEELEDENQLTFYPLTIRKRLRDDLQNPPTTALYLGDVP